MDENLDNEYCCHCKSLIPKDNFAVHSAHCVRNVEICIICKQGYPKTQMTDHFNDMHVFVKCDKCEESMQKWKLGDHKNLHCKKRNIICQYCKLSKSAGEIDAHVSYCGSRSMKCAKCLQYFQLKNEEQHKNSCCVNMQSDFSIKCGYCDTPVSYKIYNEHLSKCKDEKKECPYCSKSFTVVSFKDHVQSCSKRYDRQNQKDNYPDVEAAGMNVELESASGNTTSNISEADTKLEDKRSNSTNAKSLKIVIPDDSFKNAKQTLVLPEVSSMYFKSKFAKSNNVIDTSNTNNEVSIRDDGDHAEKDYVEKNEDEVENKQNETKEYENIPAVTCYESVVEYARSKNMIYEFMTQQIGQKKKHFVCILRLGYSNFTTYPKEISTEEEAKEFAASLALQAIVKEGSYTEAEVNEEENKKCDWCEKFIPTLEYDMHIEKCFHEEIACSHCGEKGTRNELKGHECAIQNSTTKGFDTTTEELEKFSDECMWCSTYSTRPYVKGVCHFEDISCNLCNEEFKCYNFESHLKTCIKDEMSKVGARGSSAISEEPEKISCKWCSKYLKQNKCNEDVISCDKCDKNLMCYDFKNHLKTCTTVKTPVVEEIVCTSDSEEIEEIIVEQCPRCHKSFEKYEIPSHLKECDPSYKSCKYCGGEFLTVEYKRHAKRCKEKARKDAEESHLEMCGLCLESFKKTELKEHMQNCSSLVITCDSCERSIPRSVYYKHRETCKPAGSSETDKPVNLINLIDDTDEFVTCQTCSQQMTVIQYQSHIFSCNKMLKNCPTCKVTMPASQLRAHKSDCKGLRYVAGQNSVTDLSTVKDSALTAAGGLIVCHTCDQRMTVIEYQTHMPSCGKILKDCPTCKTKMPASQLLDHRSKCKALPIVQQQNVEALQSPANMDMNLKRSDQNMEKMCPNCNTNFPYKQFQLHVLKCVQERKICPMCNTGIPGITFANHQKICNPQQTTSEEMKLHEDQNEFKAKVENAVELFPCKACNKKFSPKQLTDHAMVCSKRLVKCTECGSQMELSDLSVHRISCSKNMKYDANKVNKHSMEQGAIPRNKYNIKDIGKQENMPTIKSDAVTSSNISEVNSLNFTSKRISNPKVTSFDDVKKHSKKSKENTNNEHSERHLQAVDSSSVQSNQIISGTQVAQKYEGSCNKPIGRQAQTCHFCKKDFATHQDFIDHYDTCDFRLSKCMYCGDEVQEMNIASHQAACAEKAAQYPSVNRGGVFNAPKQEPYIHVESTLLPKQEPDVDVILVNCPTCSKKCTLEEIQSHAPACKARQSAQGSNTNKVPDSRNQSSDPGSYARENFANVVEAIPALCPLCNNQYPHTIIFHHGIDCIKKFLLSVQLDCPVCEGKYHVSDIDGHISQCRKRKLFMFNCLTCGKQLTAQESAQHVTECEAKSDEMKFICCLCREEIEVSLLKAHIDYCLQRNKLQTKLTCDLCSQKFKTDVIHDHTMKCCRDVIESIKVSCSICDEQVLVINFDDHMPCQPKRSCPWCGIKYPDPVFMKHVDQCDERQIECIICNAAIVYSDRKAHQQECFKNRGASSLYETKPKVSMNDSVEGHPVEKAMEVTESLEFKALQCLSCDKIFPEFEVEEHVKVCVSTLYRNIRTGQTEERCTKCSFIFPSVVCLHHKRTCTGKGHGQAVDSGDNATANYSEGQVIVTSVDAIKSANCRLIKCLSCDAVFSKLKVEQHTKVCVTSAFEIINSQEEKETCLNNCGEMIPKSLVANHQKACCENQIEPGPNISMEIIDNCKDCGKVLTAADIENHSQNCRKNSCVFCNEKFDDSAIHLHQRCCPKQETFPNDRDYVEENQASRNSQHQHNTCSGCAKSNPKGFTCGYCNDVRGSSGDTKQNNGRDHKDYENSLTESYKLSCEYCRKPIICDRYLEHMQRCKKDEKKCQHCFQYFPMSIYKDHLYLCDLMSKSYNGRGRGGKNKPSEAIKCLYCTQYFNLKKLIKHQVECGQRLIPCERCFSHVPASVYLYHIENCSCINQAYPNAEALKKKGFLNYFKDGWNKVFGRDGNNSDAASYSHVVQKGSLNSPSNIPHLQDDELNIPCEFCPAMFHSFDDLLLHATKSHIDETSYVKHYNNEQKVYSEYTNETGYHSQSDEKRFSNEQNTNPVLPDYTNKGKHVEGRKSGLSISEDHQNRASVQHHPNYTPPRPSCQNSRLSSGVSDDEGTWRQHRKQHSDEMNEAVERARQRAEEEKRYEQSKQSAQEKAKALEKGETNSPRPNAMNDQFQGKGTYGFPDSDSEDSNDGDRSSKPSIRQHNVGNDRFPRNGVRDSHNDESEDSDDNRRNQNSGRSQINRAFSEEKRCKPQISSSEEDSLPQNEATVVKHCYPQRSDGQSTYNNKDFISQPVPKPNRKNCGMFALQNSDDDEDETNVTAEFSSDISRGDTNSGNRNPKHNVKPGAHVTSTSVVCTSRFTVLNKYGEDGKDFKISSKPQKEKAPEICSTTHTFQKTDRNTREKTERRGSVPNVKKPWK